MMKVVLTAACFILLCNPVSSFLQSRLSCPHAVKSKMISATGCVSTRCPTCCISTISLNTDQGDQRIKPLVPRTSPNTLNRRDCTSLGILTASALLLWSAEAAEDRKAVDDAAFYSQWRYARPADILPFIFANAKQGDIDGILAAMDEVDASARCLPDSTESGRSSAPTTRCTSWATKRGASSRRSSPSCPSAPRRRPKHTRIAQIEPTSLP
jgi:hypothetical protein